LAGPVPVIHLDVRELERLLGKAAPDRATLAATIPLVGAEVESSEGDEWAVEFFPDRPDLYSVEGLARALRAYTGAKPGLRAYPVKPGKEVLRIDASVKEVRPHVLAAVVEGLEFTDRRIQALMELQEDLHWGVGARRRKASIGVHDKARLAPPYTYKAVGLDEVAFVPLQGSAPMTPREILGKHPKGMAFAHLVDGERAPLLVDSRDQVLSFPPIINGTLTTVTESTTDVLVDVTGPDARAVRNAMNLVATSLAEAGGTLRSVTLLEGRKKRTSPDLAPQAWKLQADAAPNLLGLALTPAQQAKALQRMGHGATPGKGSLKVEVPAYRVDVLHAVDLVEDVAIGHGYANFPYAKPEAVTYGKAHPLEVEGARAREVLLGLGFTEVMTLSLASDALELDQLGLTARPAARVANPITEDHTSLRTTLLGSLLALLQKNVHREYPQQVFEVGDVVWHMGEGLPSNARMVGWVKAHSRANFAEAKGLALAIARDLALPAQVQALDPQDPFAGVFIQGRAATIGPKEDPWGWFGEISPRTLDAFGLGQPAIAMELRLGQPRREGPWQA
jgi:phenylalanyl-tRNA synthetase beta chain